MDGIYQYDGEVPAEQYAQGIRAGDVKWRDVDDNNLINDNDRQVIGSSNPYFSGGWNNTFRYKGVSLDVFFTYMYGNDVYAAWKINTSKLGHKNGVLAEEARQPLDGTRFDRSPSALGERRHEQHPATPTAGSKTVRSCGCVR